MDIELKSKPKKRLPYWAVLLIGVIVTGVVANFLANILLAGGFTSWKTLPKLPSQVKHIIYADINNVWVETKDGQVFNILLNCNKNENCYQETKVDNIPSLGPMAGLDRGIDCTSITREKFPLPPFGKVVECVKVVYSATEWGSIAYIALMADGTMVNWGNTDSTIVMEIFPPMFTFMLSFSVAILISAVYLIKNITQRVRAK